MSSSVGACIDTMDMLLDGNASAPVFQTMCSVFVAAVLVHKHLLLCVKYCSSLSFQLQTYSVVTLSIKPKDDISMQVLQNDKLIHELYVP